MLTYPSKLLLFGEYAVTLGASALALPTAHFSGHWAWGEGASQQQALNEWTEYLAAQAAELLDAGCRLDIELIRADLKQGLFFESNIPLGYGLGSSGALCAALYERYAANPIEKNDEDAYPQLKSILALMESFFHGASSGIDPLVSYVQRPLLLKGRNQIKAIELSAPANGRPCLFLLDTGISRQTGPLVQWFSEQNKLPDFAGLLQSELLPYNEAAIAAVLAGQWDQLREPFEQISRWQLRHLPPMIPKGFHKLWEKGLQDGAYLLKLCGAGGGGFLLGWASSEAEARHGLADSVLVPVFG